MADKMMRIAGRSAEGLAKAIQTTKEGVLKTSLSHEVVVEDEYTVPNGNYTVPIGQPLNNIFVNEYNYLRITVITDTPHPYKMQGVIVNDRGNFVDEDGFLTNDGLLTTTVSDRLHFIGTSKKVKVTGKIPVYFDVLNLRIENLDSVEHSYKVRVTGYL